ncbi:MAG TPA: hypothetical protein VEK08_07780 [Planctomycetota bacterium]|nr:hypothetical protein [Planctomycetota bacterium]
MRLLQCAAIALTFMGGSALYAASYDDGSYSSRNCYYDSYGRYVCPDYSDNRTWRESSYDRNRGIYTSDRNRSNYYRSDSDRRYSSDRWGRTYNGRTYDRRGYDRGNYGRSYGRSDRGVGVNIGGFNFGVGR